MIENNRSNNEGVAYLIEFQDKLQKREFSPIIPMAHSKIEPTMYRRRVLSPKTKCTYIAFSNVKFKQDRYQEQSINIKFKHIRACIRTKKISSKKHNDVGEILNIAKEKLSIRNKEFQHTKNKYDDNLYLSSPHKKNNTTSPTIQKQGRFRHDTWYK